ncbi:MAG: adenylyl-sulfate kinase [Thermodesulfovibrio sp.]|nr:adenylyl-sulfate kinase [Thermodesulfovibrio sp.]MDW7998978.1 adenylyl-sulfate kinase [Thermodesulfovibrio sp.]
MKEKFNNRGICIWLTGLPCSGKTTIAKELSEQFEKASYQVKVFDGNEVRKTISKDLGFSKEDRIENMFRVAKLAKEFVEQGYIVICALISPYRNARNKIRKMFENGEFIEVFVDAPLRVCESRDIKNMYKKAREGLIENFTGINDPYEPPEMPEVHLKTDLLSIQECVYKILKFLNNQR